MRYDLLTAAGWRSVLKDLHEGQWARPWRFWWRDTLTRFSPQAASAWWERIEQERQKRILAHLSSYLGSLDEVPH